MLHPNISQLELKSLRDLTFCPYDEVIDVRSPAEYLDDHIPGSINLPVLDNEERSMVGLEHKQKGPFLARRLGAQIISRNIASILEEHLGSRDQAFKPLIYCWRGGKRSGSIAEICRQIGWQTAVLKRGYKSYRKLVVYNLYQGVFPFDIILLGGNTGSGKTEILETLPKFGIQVLNLEKLADHRGSVFGQTDLGQPTQKYFESRIMEALTTFSPTHKVVVEAESCKIGNVAVPPALWQKMKEAGRINIQAPLEDRVQYCLRSYRNLLPKGKGLTDLIGKLERFHPKKQILEWKKMADGSDFEELVTQLLFHHYDPRYGEKDCLETLNLEDLSEDSITSATKYIAGWVKSL